MLYKCTMGIELWQVIKKARKAAGLSQEELGAACSPPVSKAAVGLWETANPVKRTRPKYHNLQTICRLTGLSLSGLLEANIFNGDVEWAYETPISESDLELLRLYRQASDATKEVVLHVLRSDPSAVQVGVKGLAAGTASAEKAIKSGSSGAETKKSPQDQIK